MTSYLIPAAYFTSTLLIAGCAAWRARELDRTKGASARELFESFAHVISGTFIATAYTVNISLHHQ